MVSWSDLRLGPTALEQTAAPATAAMAAAAASLQSHVELVLGSQVGELTPDQRRVLEAGWRSGRRLVGLIDDLHTVALAEAGLLEVEWSTVDLAELVTRAAERAWPVAKVEQKPIRIDATGPTHVNGAEAVLGRSLDALVEYAVEHARRGHEIEIVVGDATVELTYAAARPPAADELSVALASAVCRLHGGEVAAAHEDGRATLGLRFGDPADAAPTAG